MEKRGQNIIFCNNCGNNTIKPKGSFGNTILLTGFSMILVGIFIPFLGWFLMIPIGFIVLLSSFIILAFEKKKTVQCQSCKHKFNVSKETIIEYKQSIK
ncbi:hypothetical protein [Carnobacterium maltaromaticum]|uniref:hypothetical protein n=1 Tax=Carnobacterium maltaromaticum TaxID=2751 RepID=UPI00026C8A3D|nr:hypothetical protein [Carnobacterium maltaromaticum]